MAQSDRDKWDERYRDGAYAERTHPSALLADWIERIPSGRALDIACGAGRNALFLASRGFAVDAIDISRAALDRARESARRAGLAIHWVEHDLDEPLVLDPGYALILVIRYVNLPLVRRLAPLLALDGFLICEEHLDSDADVVGPTNPAFRVRPGALREAAGGLHVHHYEEGIVTDPDGRAASVARLVAQSTMASRFPSFAAAQRKPAALD